MELKNYTHYTHEDIGRRTFSRYVKISSLVDLLNGNIFIPSFEIVRKADPQELGIPAYSYAFLERDFFNHANFEQEQIGSNKNGSNGLELGSATLGMSESVCSWNSGFTS